MRKGSLGKSLAWLRSPGELHSICPLIFAATVVLVSPQALPYLYLNLLVFISAQLTLSVHTCTRTHTHMRIKVLEGKKKVQNKRKTDHREITGLQTWLMCHCKSQYNMVSCFPQWKSLPRKSLMLEMFVKLDSGFLTSLVSIQETATKINNWISCLFFFFLFPPAVVKAFSFHVLLKILWCCQGVLKRYLKKDTEPKPFTKPS